MTGEALRRKRERKGISLRKLAAEAGFSAAYVSDIELGRRTMNGATEKRLADAYATLAAAAERRAS